jgi:hypothetical protein
MLNHARISVFRGGEESRRRIGVTAGGRTGVSAYGCGGYSKPDAETPIRFFYEAGTIGATIATLVPATNKAATQYTSQSVTTGLIAGSDLVIVSISGVIKKYK